MFLPKASKLLFSLLIVILISTLISVNAMVKLKLQKDTEHFLFYCTKQDVSCLNDFSQILEENYQRVCNDLGYFVKDKIKIKIYPDLQTFHNETKNPGAPDWFVGQAKNGEILLTSPLNPGPAHDYRSLQKAIVHEFTHIVLYDINFPIPIWLNEGIASFEADQMDENQRNYIAMKIKANHIPNIKDLETDWIGFAYRGGYEWSYTIVELGIHDYGREKVREWVRNGGNIKTTFGINDDKFQEEWICFIKKNYIKN